MKRSTRKQLHEFAQAARLPGLVISTVSLQDEERLVWGDGLHEHARFPIASVTKTFTAALVRHCGVHLDAPIRSVWPSFAHPDPRAAEDMTPREALGHLSGLPPHTWAWVFGDVPRRDFFTGRFPHLSCSGPFRDQHRYSNLLYAALGQLVEEVTGQSWERRLQEGLLDPLGLKDTGVLEESTADLVPPDGEEPPGYYRGGHLIAPASEMFSTAPDLARWGRHCLANGPDPEGWRPVSRIADGLSYGLGWRLDAPDGLRRVWHSGQCSGYTALLTLYPEQNRGCALLCNRSNALTALHAMDRFLSAGAELPTPVSEVRKRPSPALPNFGNGKCPTGIFQNPGYGRLEIFEEGNALWSRFQNGDAVEVLQDASGHPVLQLPVFGVRFPLRAEADRLCVPFEPAVPEIVFNQG